MATWWELSLITWRSLFLQDKARRCHGLWRLPAILRTVLRCPRKGLCRNVCRLHGVNGRGKKQILLIMGVTTAARKVTFTYSSLCSITARPECQPSICLMTSAPYAVKPSLLMSARRASLRTHSGYPATMCILHSNIFIGKWELFISCEKRKLQCSPAIARYIVDLLCRVSKPFFHLIFFKSTVKPTTSRVQVSRSRYFGLVFFRRLLVFCSVVLGCLYLLIQKKHSQTAAAHNLVGHKKKTMMWPCWSAVVIYIC